MRKIDRAREEIKARVCKKICVGGDCRCDQLEVTVTSRRFIINIPHLGVCVEQRNENDAVRCAQRKLAAIRIRDGIGRRSEFNGLAFTVDPHPESLRGFVLRVPARQIEVTARSQRTLVEKALPRLLKMSA